MCVRVFACVYARVCDDAADATGVISDAVVGAADAAAAVATTNSVAIVVAASFAAAAATLATPIACVCLRERVGAPWD